MFLPQSRAAEDFSITIPARFLVGYDAGLPLHANAQKTLENDTFTRYHVTYLNDRGDTVPGILTLPKTTNSPFQTVFFQHGMGDTKDCNYMLKGTKRFVELGYAVFAIDAMSFGERATPITTTCLSRHVLQVSLSFAECLDPDLRGRAARGGFPSDPGRC